LSRDAVLLHTSAVIEISLAAVITVIGYSSPIGSFHLIACGSHRLADWYTIFHNPSSPYDQLNCTSESVYPLYSIVFAHLFGSLVCLLVVRPFFIRCTNDRNALKTVYLTLYLVPALALIHFVGAGLICK
jgi:hypothetical protein